MGSTKAAEAGARAAVRKGSIGKSRRAPAGCRNKKTIAAAMKGVTSALAAGTITPGEAATIAAVVDTFVWAIETSDFDRRLQEVEKSFAQQRLRASGIWPGGYHNR